ncbi:DUF2345 domain-containing protein, partial [Gilliamella sp. B3000]
AQQDIKIDSVDGELTITASEALTLMCGGSFIKISHEGIELGTADNVYIKSNALQKMGTAQKDIPEITLPKTIVTEFLPNKSDQNDKYSLKFLMVNDEAEPYKKTKYLAFMEDGSVICGETDDNGYTERFYTEKEEKIVIRLILSKTSKGEIINL